MTSLQWQEMPNASAHASQHSASTGGLMAINWFAVSIGLMGIIAGYAIGNMIR